MLKITVFPEAYIQGFFHYSIHQLILLTCLKIGVYSLRINFLLGERNEVLCSVFFFVWLFCAKLKTETVGAPLKSLEHAKDTVCKLLSLFDFFPETLSKCQKRNFQLEKLPCLKPKSGMKMGGHPLTK